MWRKNTLTTPKTLILSWFGSVIRLKTPIGINELYSPEIQEYTVILYLGSSHTPVKSNQFIIWILHNVLYQGQNSTVMIIEK